MRIILLACLALLTTCVIARDSRTLAQQWSDYKAQFNKVYPTEEAEFLAQQAFFENVKQIAMLREQHFLQHGETADHIYGWTKFSDITAEDFKARYLNYKPSGRKNKHPIVKPIEKDVSSPPTKFNWFTQGACTPVKDQGQCGSCWAFSATEEIESSWILSNHTMVALSPQQIVSCDQNDGGCGGGDTITAYQYVQSAGGLETEKQYPYTSGNSGDNGQCKFNQADTVVTVTGYSYAIPPCQDACNHQNETELLDALFANGPVSICVYAESWQNYVGGVLKSNCPHAYSDLDHCVQLTGYDKTTSPGYWIIRNSWNTDWGLSGFIWVQMGSNLCGVGDEATFVSVAPA